MSYIRFIFFILFMKVCASMALCTELSGPPQVISAQETILCTESVFESRTPDTSNCVFRISEFVETVFDTLDNDHQERPLYFNLRLCALENDELNKLNKDCFQQKRIRDKVQVIDISDNLFDTKCAPTIVEILELPSLKYLNVYGTCYSLRRIKRLLTYMKEREKKPFCDSEKTLELTKKLIFMAKSYISKAKKTVQIYQDMEAEGLLSKEWDASHDDYYKNYEKHLEVPSQLFRTQEASSLSYDLSNLAYKELYENLLRLSLRNTQE